MQRLAELRNQGGTAVGRFAAFERAAFVLVAALLVAAIIAVLGKEGDVATPATAGERSIAVHAERYGRFHESQALTAQVGPGASPDGLVRVWLHSDFISGVQIVRVAPEPVAVEAAADRLIYVFHQAGGDGHTSIVFTLQPRQVGALNGQAGVVGGRTVEFTQFVYP